MPTQSQYATPAQIQQLAITPAVYARFEASSPGCVVAALQSASSIADSYLPSQFTLPLQVSPQGWDMSLTMYTCWIAAWMLYNSFGFSPQAPLDELIIKRYESALDWLAQIRDKKIFPQYIDSVNASSSDPEQGAFVISDPPVGFTPRGVANDFNQQFDPWFWWN